MIFLSKVFYILEFNNSSFQVLLTVILKVFCLFCFIFLSYTMGIIFQGFRSGAGTISGRVAGDLKGLFVQIIRNTNQFGSALLHVYCYFEWL